jgi:hypothetical protein
MDRINEETSKWKIKTLPPTPIDIKPSNVIPLTEEAIAQINMESANKLPQVNNPSTPTDSVTSFKYEVEQPSPKTETSNLQNNNETSNNETSTNNNETNNDEKSTKEKIKLKIET